MKKIHLTILEEDREYVRLLALAVRKRGADGIEVSWYTKIESYDGDEERQKADLLLVGTRFQEESLLKRLQREHGEGGLILLVEDGVTRELLEYPVIEKYRPAEWIVKEIYRCASALPCEEAFLPGWQGCLTGIYGPWNQELTMLFAEVLLQIVSEKEAALYVSLQEGLGRKVCREAWEEENLADFISFLRLGTGSAAARLKSVCRELGRGKCLPPVDDPEHLAELTREDYERLWKAVREQDEYGEVLVEFGGAYPGIYEDMRYCSVIYCPYQEEALQRERRQQLEHILKLHEAEEIFERMQFVKLPRLAVFGGAGEMGLEAFVRELLYNEFGDTVRELVSGNRG